MKKTRTRLWSLLLTVAMLLTLLPTTALAGEDTPQEEKTSEEDGGQQKPNPKGDAVASVGEKTYSSLLEAVSEVADGAVVTLLQNVSSDVISFNKDITIDLAGHTWTGTGQYYVFQVSDDCDVTIRDGNIDGTSAYLGQVTAGNVTLESCAITITDCLFCQGGTVQLTDTDLTVTAANAFGLQVNDGTVTVDKDSTVTANATDRAIGIYVKGTDNNASPVVNVYGTIRSYGPAIQGNGTDRSYPEINISGAKIETTKLALYLPQPGAVTITDSTISGYAGIGMKSGTLNIVDSTVKGIANDAVLDDEDSNTNGIATDGSAIVIDSYVGYAGEVNVTISGNSIIQSAYSTAIREIGNTAGQTNVVTLNISGGQILGAAGKDAVLVRDVTKETVSITGGIFSSNPEEYVPTGYVSTSNDDGTFTVQAKEGGEMVVKPDTSSGGTTSATLEGVYAGKDTTVETPTEGVGSDTAGTAGIDVTIDLTTTDSAATDTTELTVKKETAASLTDAQSFTVTTDVGSVTLDKDALEKMGRTDSDVTISITKVETTSGAEAVVAAYTVEVKSEKKDQNLLPEGQQNGQITITIDKPNAETFTMWYAVQQGGGWLYIEKLEHKEVAGGKIEVYIGHLSSIVAYTGTADPGTAVASIQDEDGNIAYYATLADAIAAAEDGDNVTLLKDVTVSKDLALTKSLDLDLAEKTLTLADNVKIQITGEDNVLNIRNGEFNGNRTLLILCYQGATVNLTSVTGKNSKAEGSGTYEYSNFIQLGSVYSTGHATITDCQLTAGGNVVYILGKQASDSSTPSTCTIINSTMTSRNPVSGNGQCYADVTIESGTFTALWPGYKGSIAAVYWPCAGTLTINGGSFSGDTAIYAKSGTIEIKGGTFKGTGVDTAYSPEGNGFIATGDAIVLDSNNYPGGAPKLTITGGMFQSTYAGAVADYCSEAASGAPAQGNITGGTFSASVAEYVAGDLKYELDNNGKFTYYPTLSAALANAESGAVIKGPAEDGQGAATYYTVIFDTNGGSYVSPQTVESGSTAKEPAAPSREGYRFTGWYLNGYTYNFSTKVIESITLTAGWKKIGSGGTAPVRDITVDSGSHGDVEVWPEEAKQGTTVTITADPDKGYEVAEVVVTDENGAEITVTDKGDGKYTFTMPNSDVTIEVTFQAVSGGSVSGGDLTITAPAGWVNPYSDVAAGAWYYDAVGYASANGLMGGVGNNAFAPEGSMNRAMVWTVIARLAGQTITGATWAEDAKAWAVAQGVSDGTNPDGTVTREELVTMLYRYIGSPAMNVPELALIGNYSDSADMSAWAQNAFAWAISRGIIDGRDGKLAAGSPVTRAEAATILARFHLLTK